VYALSLGGRGRGVARALMAECERVAAEWGYDEIFLTTDSDNFPALR
jgi:ribosomal protein S18 acetylase RimI-like enzyme